MLIEIDEENEKIIRETFDYIGLTKLEQIGDRKYINTNELLSIIDDLNAELRRTIETFEDYDKQINETTFEHFINEQIDKGLHPHEYK